jgi:isopentenyl-diphosphate delta-isomerase
MSEQEPEIIDLVDENDQVIKQIERDDSVNNVETHGGYIRVVDCYIMNSEGELWVPRRTVHKRIAPNGLDFSIGEHIQTGETYKDAIIRGFQEEVGFTPDKDKLEFLGVSKPNENGDIFQGFFIYHSDVAPELNPEDFVEATWMKPDELIDKIESGEIAKSNIVPSVRKFLLTKS